MKPCFFYSLSARFKPWYIRKIFKPKQRVFNVIELVGAVKTTPQYVVGSEIIKYCSK